MKEITKDMIKVFEIKKLGYDFMGYTFNRTEDLSFHHLIVPKRDCKAAGLGDGYLFWNGAILKQTSSHEYLHTIERIDRQAFERITQFLIEENEQRKIDREHLLRIREELLKFEEQYWDAETKKGQRVMKKQYTQHRIQL